MILLKLTVLLNICFLTSAKIGSKTFPNDFLFGVSSSSYQIEGAWNESGKGPSIWDWYTHEKSYRIENGSNGDIACDSYHKIKEDVAIIKNLGVEFYRFSLSWPRILPTGYIDKINPDGIRYYNELIDELLKNKIQPMVTLYHWELPQPLFEAGGWPNPFLADYFADYARIAFENFGDRVKLWLTINEPYMICNQGYNGGIFAPAFNTNGYANYMCGYTILIAHAKAWHIYDDEFRQKQGGKIGITIDTFWMEPKTDSKEDEANQELILQMNFGWFAHPIFSKTGDYPPLMKQQIAALSRANNLRRTRLPPLSQSDIAFVRNTSDFLGLNHYSTFLISAGRITAESHALFNRDIDAHLDQDSNWEKSDLAWLAIVPSGMRKLLNWLRKEYDNPIVYITENGYGGRECGVNDETRVKYLKKYLGAVLDAILEDGCNVKAYSVWSLMDSFEWNEGYTAKFGLHHIDFSDPDRKRIPKSSAFYYNKVVQTRSVDHPYEKVDYSGAIKCGENYFSSKTSTNKTNLLYFVVMFLIVYFL